MGTYPVTANAEEVRRAAPKMLVESQSKSADADSGSTTPPASDHRIPALLVNDPVVAVFLRGGTDGGIWLVQVPERGRRCPGYPLETDMMNEEPVRLALPGVGGFGGGVVCPFGAGPVADGIGVARIVVPAGPR